MLHQMLSSMFARLLLVLTDQNNCSFHKLLLFICGRYYPRLEGSTPPILLEVLVGRQKFKATPAATIHGTMLGESVLYINKEETAR